jgi:MFS family permease
MVAMNTNTSSNFTRGLIVLLSLLFVLTLSAMIISPYMLGDEEFELWMLIVNALLIAIPIGLLYALMGVLITAVYRHRHQEELNPRLAKFIYLSPRISGIVLIAFMSLFAFDVFEEGTLAEMLLAFLMHMLPMIALAIVLAFAWRWPWIGAAFFGIAALAFSLWAFTAGMQGFGTFLLIGAPLLMIALLFGANARWKQEIDSARHLALHTL